MISVKFYGMFREKVGAVEMSLEACSLDRLLKEICRVSENISVKELKQSMIFINKKPLSEYSGFKTKLEDGFEVAFLSPSGGG